jgi:two-component system sensor histidine kinase BaeS
VVVASALYRMHVYQEAYGFTELRLLVDVFEAWLGLLVVAVMVAGVRLRGAWLPRAAVLTGAGALLGLALVNPDAWIAEHNLERYAETGRIDWTYISGLSTDIAPALEGQPDDVVACALMGQTAIDDDWLEWNLGRHRAEAVVSDHLEGRGSGEPACLSAD